jgi:hypothetical protein
MDTTKQAISHSDNQLLADVDSFLLSGKESADSELDTAQSALADLIKQAEKSMSEIDSTLQSAQSLTGPLEGDAVERYEALTEAQSVQFRTWEDLQHLIDILSAYGNRWREYGGEIESSIKSYSNVFGFPLPEGMRRKDCPDSGDFTTSDGIPF